MQRLPAIVTGMLIAQTFVGGCARRVPENSKENEATESSAVWLEQNLKANGMTIALGHRGHDLQAGDWLEPIVAITKDGQPVADAMVFYRLMADDDQKSLGDEVPAVFEAASDGESACYAHSKLRMPEGTASCTVHFRIILPGVDEEWTRDVTLRIR